MSYTNRTCKGKTCQGHSLYCAVIAVKENVFSCTHEQLKLVKEKRFEKKLVHRTVHTSKESYQGTCQGKLGRLCGALNFYFCNFASKNTCELTASLGQIFRCDNSRVNSK